MASMSTPRAAMKLRRWSKLSISAPRSSCDCGEQRAQSRRSLVGLALDGEKFLQQLALVVVERRAGAQSAPVRGIARRFRPPCGRPSAEMPAIFRRSSTKARAPALSAPERGEHAGMIAGDSARARGSSAIFSPLARPPRMRRIQTGGRLNFSSNRREQASVADAHAPSFVGAGGFKRQRQESRRRPLRDRRGRNFRAPPDEIRTAPWSADEKPAHSSRRRQGRRREARRDRRAKREW